MNGRVKRDRRAWLLAIAALVILFDRLTKLWIIHHVEEGDAIVVVQRVFRITHVRNPGAAFSMFTESTRPEMVRWVLSGFSILAAAVVLFAILRFGRRMTPTMIALALILGGTIGNLWDRLRSGLVTDFLEVHIIHYHWPDFNVADSAIVIGGILLVLDALFSGTKEPSS
ncbi:MAG TPA: signal peptidase II [Acidobacteriaceae bacterium]|nr:signal peptidase II [Acidobacteriaceae bacterium]